MKNKSIKLKSISIGLVSTLALSLPIALVIACSNSSSAELGIASEPALSNLVTSDGTLNQSTTQEGWSISLVEGSSDVEIAQLSAGQSYRIKFELQSEFALPTEAITSELSLDPENSGTYYTAIMTYVAYAENLENNYSLGYDSISSSWILPNLRGWTVNAFRYPIGSEVNPVEITNELLFSEEFMYLLEFTTIDGYEPREIGGEFVKIETPIGNDNEIYRLRDLTLTPADIISATHQLNYIQKYNIYVTSTGPSWNTTVYNAETNELISNLQTLDGANSYYIQHEIQSGFAPLLLLNGLEEIIPGSVYRTNTFIVADAINEEIVLNYDLETSLPVLPTIFGWDIKVYSDNLGTEITDLSTISSGDQYYLGFTILDGSTRGNVTGLTINSATNSFLTEAKTFIVAEALNDLNTLLLWDGTDFSTPTPVGWDVKVFRVVAGSIDTEITSLSTLPNGDQYYLQFTLQNGFLFSGIEIDQLITIDEGTYYQTTTKVIERTAASLSSDLDISYDSVSDELVLPQLNGWTVEVFEVVENDADLNVTNDLRSIAGLDQYYIRFTLQSDWVFSEASGLNENVAESIYQTSLITNHFAEILSSSDARVSYIGSSTTNFDYSIPMGTELVAILVQNQDQTFTTYQFSNQLTPTNFPSGSVYKMQVRINSDFEFAGQNGSFTVVTDPDDPNNIIYETELKTITYTI